MTNKPDRKDAVSGASRERRRLDRRGSERRVADRREHPSLWRHPAAYVACGVLASLLAIVGFRGIVWPTTASSPPRLAAASASPTPRDTAQAGASVMIREGRSVAEYEILLAEGEKAVGAIVRTELVCQPITQMTLRVTQTPNPALERVADGEHRVAAAECRWSDGGRTAEFFLVIPPGLAQAFTAIPEKEMNFVPRRKVAVQVEWLGRSEALSLRTAGVLLAIDS